MQCLEKVASLLQGNRQTVTNLNGLVPEGGVGEIVLVDFISCCVYVDGSYYLDRYATLWRKTEISL